MPELDHREAPMGIGSGHRYVFICMRQTGSVWWKPLHLDARWQQSCFDLEAEAALSLVNDRDAASLLLV